MRQGKDLTPIRAYIPSNSDALEKLRYGSTVDDYGCLNYGRGLDGRGYGVINVKAYPTKKAHVLAYVLEYGAVPEGLVVDHICGNTRCIEPKHLRAVTRKQNSENMVKLNKTNTSGFRGVYWSKAHKYWVAKIVHHGKQITRNGFDTAEKANEAAKMLRNSYYTHNPEIDMYGGR